MKGSLHARIQPKRGGKKVEITPYLDSGASRSVCPQTHAEQYPCIAVDPAKALNFRTATNKKVPCLGERTVVGNDAEGNHLSMKYQVADVTVALDSVSQICDTGAKVVFEKHAGTS